MGCGGAGVGVTLMNATRRLTLQSTGQPLTCSSDLTGSLQRHTPKLAHGHDGPWAQFRMI